MTVTPSIPLRVGIVGLGFMGRTHLGAFLAAQQAGYPCVLAAVCDPSPEKRAGRFEEAAGNIGSGAAPLFDTSRVKGHAEFDSMLDAEIDAVSICTYTDTHVALATKALAAGKHVLIEKPVALHAPEIERLARAAQDAGRICMPAMCMRFWPGWPWLRDRITSASPFGPLRSVTFQRMGSGPSWASSFYKDPSRSGGALVDLHIHDADFIYWTLGRPRAVSCTGDSMHFCTQYFYDSPQARPPMVVAHGAWDLTPSAGFRMKYLATFERATAEFDISADPTVKVHTPEGTSSPTLPAGSGYDGEIRHFIDVVTKGEQQRATLAEAAGVARLLAAEAESMRTGKPVPVE
ncbi:MAG: Gfo/Idh/MocA family oxidoreductase [Phycisphaeraceae bacterium]|nr:Gfo/Idh/MocA family oxidoreductase [Phycisphaeraceae bacterium]